MMMIPYLLGTCTPNQISKSLTRSRISTRSCILAVVAVTKLLAGWWCCHYHQHIHWYGERTGTKGKYGGESNDNNSNDGIVFDNK